MRERSVKIKSALAYMSRQLSLVLVASGFLALTGFADEADPIFDPGRMETIRVAMPDSSWQALRQCERGWVEATVTYRDVRLERVGVQGHNRRDCDPRFQTHPNLMFDFGRNIPQQRFFGLNRLNARSWCCDDDTLLVEDLEIELFRQFGLPAARLAHVRLFVNDQYIGVYNILDRTNEDMSAVVPRFFENPNGNLYLLKNTAARTPTDAFLSNPENPDSPASYIPDPFRPVVLNDDGSDIVALIQVLNSSPQQETWDRLSGLIHLDKLIDYLAVDMSIADTDGLIAYDPFLTDEMHYYQNNSFFYHDPITGLFYIFPGDLDDGFMAFDANSVNRWLVDGWSRMTITQWMLDDAQVIDQYYRRVGDFVNQVYVPDRLIDLVNRRVSLMGDAVREDLQRPQPLLSYERWVARVQALREYIRNREANIRRQLAEPPLWRVWEKLDHIPTLPPVAVSWGGPHLSVFVRGADNALYHRRWDGFRWNPWENLGGVLVSPPAVVSREPNSIDVFVQGADGALYHIFWNGAGWSAWENLGGTLASAPTVVSRRPNSLDVFVQWADDNALYYRSWDGVGWSDWISLGGVLSAPPTVVARDANSLDVFVRGVADGVLYHKSWNGAGWSGWENLGGMLASAPTVVSRGPNSLDVFVQWADDNALYYRSWDGVGWSDWISLGGVLSAPPTVVARDANSLDVFVRGIADGVLYRKSWNEAGWSDWINHGGILNAIPAAVSRRGNLEVFVQGNDNALYHRTLQ